MRADAKMQSFFDFSLEHYAGVRAEVLRYLGSAIDKDCEVSMHAHADVAGLLLMFTRLGDLRVDQAAITQYFDNNHEVYPFDFSF